MHNNQPIPTNDQDREFMRQAIELADASVAHGGGPFGAVVVKDGQVVAAAANSVTPDNDPTAHAEVNAIRQACRKLGTFDLGGCHIYTSCEPCPMCLGAIYWARLDRIYYACDRKDAAAANFADDFIYDELAVEPAQRRVPMVPLMRSEATTVFDHWAAKADRTEY